MTVYIITHSVRGEEEASFLGVYATRELAVRALTDWAIEHHVIYGESSSYCGTEEDAFFICATDLIES